MKLFELFWIFLRLGLTSFGGPIAHLGYFRQEFVQRRQWLDEAAYAELVALAQLLPGPASSQVGMALGWLRAGFWGSLTAWLAFTLPSALLMILLGIGLLTQQDLAQAGWIRGLMIMAVAVVAQAVWSMGQSLAPDRPRLLLALGVAMGASLWPGTWPVLGLLALSGLLGWRLLAALEGQRHPLPLRMAPAWGWLGLAGIVTGLLLWPLMPAVPELATALFRVGALVMGGGHVVLPLLEAEVVPRGWLETSTFLAGYGAAQALPGPLFAFAAFVGASAAPQLGWPPLMAALLALLAIFLPAFFWLVGVWPFWNQVRSLPALQAALRGVNAGVVGVLLAALYHPVFTSAVALPADFALVLLFWALLVPLRLAPWAVAALAALVGWVYL